MNKGIIMKSTGIYHPEKKVYNGFFEEHFEKLQEGLGTQVSHLLTHLGRDSRYIANFPEENVITMAVKSSLEALKQASMDALELDGIIFSTDTPEYTSPTNALLLRKELNATNAHVVYDLNANCVGMVVAIDQAQALMKSNKRIKRLLVVGSSMIHHYGLSSDPITYGALGDAAVSVILEITDDITMGFRDSIYATRTDLSNYIVMPECGLSNLYNTDIPEEKKRWKWQPFDTTEAEARCGDMIKQVAQDNSYSISEIKMIFMTQFSEDAINNVSKAILVPKDKFKYVGNEYGYTGTSSPFLAYYHSLKDGEIQKGDKIIFCSVGSGLTATSLLYIA